MIKYTLRFTPEDSAGEKAVSFYSHSTAGALDIAKTSARGNSAELLEGKKVVCRMQLIEESGVWLVIPPSSAD